MMSDETVRLPKNNEYLVTVRSTDVRPAGATGAAPTSTVDVIVTVTNLDEPGTATISLRQPEVGTELTGSATDPDGITGDRDVRVVRPQGQQAHAYERQPLARPRRQSQNSKLPTRRGRMMKASTCG